MKLEKQLLEILDSNYGRDMQSRFEKLEEEYNELKEAYENYKKDMSDQNKAKVIDELADVNAIVTHITSILGQSLASLLENCKDKVIGRLINNNYRR